MTTAQDRLAFLSMSVTPLASAGTATGVGISRSLVPVPATPYPFGPQHHAAPPATAHACPEPPLPVPVAITWVAPVIGASTSVAYGTSWESVTKPRAPDVSWPQQRTLPEKMPQLCRSPVATVAAPADGASHAASRSRPKTAGTRARGPKQPVFRQIAP